MSEPDARGDRCGGLEREEDERYNDENPRARSKVIGVDADSHVARLRLFGGRELGGGGGVGDRLFLFLLTTYLTAHLTSQLTAQLTAHAVRQIRFSFFFACRRFRDVVLG